MTSIIVPIYNASISLDRCLKSISSQQYKDWECILVDDGSADDSLSICEKWARRDARFVVMSQANGGVSVARNTALGVARGEWVTFIDADDWIDRLNRKEVDVKSPLLGYIYDEQSRFQYFISPRWCQELKED